MDNSVYGAAAVSRVDCLRSCCVNVDTWICSKNSTYADQSGHSCEVDFGFVVLRCCRLFSARACYREFCVRSSLMQLTFTRPLYAAMLCAQVGGVVLGSQM